MHHASWVTALLGFALSLQDPAPPSVADLLKQLEDKDAAVRKAAFEALRGSADPQAESKLGPALEALRNSWFKKAIQERTDAFQVYAEARKKRIDPRGHARRQKEGMALFEAGDYKKLEEFVKKFMEDFYVDPARAADDAAVIRAAGRVAELSGYMRSAGVKPKEDLEARMAEAFRGMDEDLVLGSMPAKDQSVMRDNAKLRDQVGAEEYRLVYITNQYRVLMGRAAFKLNVKLCAAAREHSKDMVEKGFFSHESPLPGKKTPQDRAARHGTSCGAENIYAGGAKADGPFSAWFHSDGHHKNMMGGAAEIGVGNHDKHWTEMFGG
jgi:hypothetical protein